MDNFSGILFIAAKHMVNLDTAAVKQNKSARLVKVGQKKTREVEKIKNC